MPRTSSPGADARDEIVSLARQRMGMGSAVFYAPSIPPAKEAAARAAHALHLPESEPVLVLYDGTLFGGAENGFVVTPERLCWKNLLAHPRQIEWSELEAAAIVPGSGRIVVAGGVIDAMNELVPGIALFLVEMARRRGNPDAGPYRSGAEASAEGALVAVPHLTALGRKHLGEVEDIYYHPAIPASKLKKARATHAAHLSAAEVVAVLYDDTVFGSAEEGMLLTPRRLCWKNLTSEPSHAEWHQIEPDSISASGNLVYVAGRALQLTSRTELCVPMAELLVALVAEVRGGHAA
jgi:hypothetical protein